MVRPTGISLEDEKAYIKDISRELGITEKQFWKDFNRGLKQSMQDLEYRLIGNTGCVPIHSEEAPYYSRFKNLYVKLLNLFK